MKSVHIRPSIKAAISALSGIFIVVLAIAAITSQAAQTRNPYRTDSLLNGRGWIQLDVPQRQLYLDGFFAGALNLQGAMVAALPAQRTTIQQTSAKYIAVQPIKEIAEQVDAFYEDAANRNIPAAIAVEWTIARARGERTEVLELMLRTMRQTWNQ